MIPTNPVFVRGLSRSGGTLLVTLLDSTSAIAMAYELYPNLLDESIDTPQAVLALADRLEPKIGRKFARSVDGSLKTYLNRLPRGGVTPAVAIDLLRQHADLGRSFGSIDDRMQFMAACANWKRLEVDKARWGLKCLNNYGEYLASFPDAQFLNIVRDPRDVLASVFANKMKNRTSESVATGWVSTHTKFEKWRTKHPDSFALVQYEKLVSEPRQEIEALCAFLNVEFSESLLAHQDKDLTIFGASHLSRDRVASAVDTSSVERWRNSLSAEAVETVQDIAGEMMEKFGYEVA